MPPAAIWVGPAVTAALVLANLVIVVSNHQRVRRMARARGTRPPRSAAVRILLTGTILVGAQLGLNLVWPHLGDIALVAFLALGLSLWLVLWRTGRRLQ